MVKIPVKFQRVADAFDEMSRVRSFESSGSEHSADLSDLLNSFFESEIREQRIVRDDDDRSRNEYDDEDDDVDDNRSELSNSLDFELRDSLKKLFDRGGRDRKRIYSAVENAMEEVAGEKNSSPEFKRRLMSRLRDRGFDAGICKSKWEKSGSTPSGNYEYVDVNAGGGDRYIVEVYLAREFNIARPSAAYASLLEGFPAIVVAKAEEVKQLVRQMSKAVRKSLKSVELNVPPWRRLAYMQAKWFAAYRRTTNEIPTTETFKNLAGNNRMVGFVAVAAAAAAAVTPFCREDFGAKRGVRFGNLAAAFMDEDLEMHAAPVFMHDY